MEKDAPIYGLLYWYILALFLSPQNEFYDNLPFYILVKAHFNRTFHSDIRDRRSIALKLSVEWKKGFSINNKVNS